MSIRLSPEKEKLVSKNLRLVHHLVNKLRIAPSEYDELVSVGTIGLVKAASTFDKSKGWSFATYAGRCINNEIFMYFRKEKKHENDVSLDDIIATDKDGKELSFADILPDLDINFVEEIADREIIEKLISIILNLLEPIRRSVMLYRLSGKNQKSIAEILNFAQSYISRIENCSRKIVIEYFTTLQPYKEVYSMSIVGDSYKISFSSRDVMQFNKIFATFLQNLTSTEALPDFKISSNKERVIIQVPAHPESFSFIAQIIQIIDEYNLTFISDTSTLTEKQSVSKEVKENESEKVVEETVIEEKAEIISDNLSTSIEVDKSSLPDFPSNSKRGEKQRMLREYILGREEFTTKEVKSQFSNISNQTIQLVLVELKEKGLITSISKGKYVTKKD